MQRQAHRGSHRTRANTGGGWSTNLRQSLHRRPNQMPGCSPNWGYMRIWAMSSYLRG